MTVSASTEATDNRDVREVQQFFRREAKSDKSVTAVSTWLHANIGVRDMVKTIEFYNLIGFEVIEDRYFEEGAGVWKGLGVDKIEGKDRRFRATFMAIPGFDGPFLDLIQFLEPATAGDAYPTLTNTGILRLAFTIDDIEAAAAALKAAGVELVSDVAEYEYAPGKRPPGPHARFICVKDPDGTFIEFVEMTDPQ